MQPLGKTPGARTFLRSVARIGYAARGTVYVLTGLVAGLTAGGFGHEPNDSQGACFSCGAAPSAIFC